MCKDCNAYNGPYSSLTCNQPKREKYGCWHPRGTVKVWQEELEERHIEVTQEALQEALP